MEIRVWQETVYRDGGQGMMLRTWIMKMDAPAHGKVAVIALRLLVAAAVVSQTGCSLIRKLAIRSLADTLASSGEVFASDEDPELVRDAVPFALKTVEGLLGEVPRHRGLLLTACKGFTQYAYAFVETDAEILEAEDYQAAAGLRDRALHLYLRARDYGLRGLELDHPGMGEALTRDPEAAVAPATIRDMALLYWTGAAWGSAVSLGRDRPELVADLPAVIAMMRRAVQLDDEFEGGAVHEVLIVLEGLPANMGGSVDRARQHFRRAVELSDGSRASPYVALAESVAVPAQDRGEFERLLGQALEVDPDSDPGSRLHNLIVQKRARHLLRQVDELFLEEDLP